MGWFTYPSCKDNCTPERGKLNAHVAKPFRELLDGFSALPPQSDPLSPSDNAICELSAAVEHLLVLGEIQQIPTETTIRRYREMVDRIIAGGAR